MTHSAAHKSLHRSGLEGQLLGVTIQHEQPELEKAKSEMLRQEEGFKVGKMDGCVASQNYEYMYEMLCSPGEPLLTHVVLSTYFTKPFVRVFVDAEPTKYITKRRCALRISKKAC